MIENECCDAGELQGINDLKLGVRVRRGWAKTLVIAKQYGVTEDQWRGFVNDGGWYADDATKAKLADQHKIDPANLALILQMMIQMMPMFMSLCPAPV